MPDPTRVNRLNICIEVPAINELDKASMVPLPDMVRFIHALVEQHKHDCKGSIAGANYSFAYEWDVDPQLGEGGLDWTAKDR